MLLREQVALSRLQQLYDPCGSTKAANCGTWSAAGPAAGGTVSRIPDGPAARGPVARARLDRYTVTNRRSAAAPARKRGCSCYAVASACAFETGVCCGPKVATENASKSGSGQQLQGFCDTREPVGSASEGSRSSRRRSCCRPLMRQKTVERRPAPVSSYVALTEVRSCTAQASSSSGAVGGAARASAGPFQTPV